MFRTATCCMMLATAALPVGAEVTGASGTQITLPSGAQAQWQETLHDSSGGTGLTYRFRFVIPDLASRLPADSAPAMADEAPRGPIDIDTESGQIDSADDGADYVDDSMIATTEPEDQDGSAEEMADAMIEDPAQNGTVDSAAQDPLHADVVWLCQNWVLPRIASPAPRPSQIIISLSDKAVPFGSYALDTVQLFEAFHLPPDRDSCEWEPW